MHVKCLAQGSAHRICLINDGNGDGNNGSGVLAMVMLMLTVIAMVMLMLMLILMLMVMLMMAIQKLDVVTRFQPFYCRGTQVVVAHPGHC